MSGWRVRIAKQADRDIADILRWTTAHFSPQQANVYAETLTLSMNTLLQGPGVPGARIRNDIQPGLYSLHVARQGRRGSVLLCSVQMMPVIVLMCCAFCMTVWIYAATFECEKVF